MRRRSLTLAAMILGALALSGCLAATAAGTAVGVTAKAAGAAAHGLGAAAGAVIP